MDSEKHLDTKTYDDVVKELVGQRISLSLESGKMQDGADQTWWQAIGKLVFGGTRDGNSWGDVEFHSASYDVDSVTAFSTVLAACLNFINSEDFQEMLITELEKAEKNKDEGQD